ncbi:MAG: hypothetical protein WC839_00735 [Candidatus Paceibacterota bacterium]
MGNFETTIEDIEIDEKMEEFSPDTFEHVLQTPEYENNDEEKTLIDEENREKFVEDIEIKEIQLEKNTDLLQFIADTTGASKESYTLTHTETWKTNGKEVFDPNGKSITEIVKNAERNGENNIQTQSHHALLDHIKNNPEEPFRFLDWVEKTEEGQKIHSAAVRINTEGNFLEVETWTREEKKEEEKPIDKIDGAKEEEEILSLEIEIDKQETVSKETIAEESLLAETLEAELENEQEIEQIIEIIENESSSNVVELEIDLTDIEEVAEEEVNTPLNIDIQEELVNIENIYNAWQIVIESKVNTTEQLVIPEEETVNILDSVQKTEQNQEEKMTESLEKIVDEKTISYVEQPIIKTEERTERVMTLEDKIRELLGYNDEPIFTEITQTETLPVLNEQAEKVVTVEEIKDVENISENVEAPAIVTETTIVDRSEQTTKPEIFVNEMVVENITQEIDIKNEVAGTITEEKDIEEKTIEIEKGFEKEPVEQVIVNIDKIENQKDINETKQVFNTEHIQKQGKEQQVVNISEITERNGILQEAKMEEEIVEKVQSSDVVVKAVDSRPHDTSKTETILSEVVDAKHVTENKGVKSESNLVQEVIVNNTETQVIGKAETVLGVVRSDKNETQNVRGINVENTKEEKNEQSKESIVNVIKGEEKVVIETKVKDINPTIEKVDNTRLKNITTERIITERKIQDKEEKPEKIVLNNDKDIKVASTRENKVVTKEATIEKAQFPNIKTEKEVRNNVLPFKTTENKPNLRNVEVEATKPVAEKTNPKKEVNKISNINKEEIAVKNQGEKTQKSNREAIVLNFKRDKVDRTIRSDAQIFSEKPREEKRTTEESFKAKPLDGHDILLQILGISQNRAELRSFKPSNSRSISNTNQEEQETKSTKSISSIYQQRNLNGITLKIAA